MPSEYFLSALRLRGAPARVVLMPSGREENFEYRVWWKIALHSSPLALGWIYEIQAASFQLIFKSLSRSPRAKTRDFEMAPKKNKSKVEEETIANMSTGWC